VAFFSICNSHLVIYRKFSLANAAHDSCYECFMKIEVMTNHFASVSYLAIKHGVLLDGLPCIDRGQCAHSCLIISKEEKYQR
jgi:hypothetical protein